MSYPTDRTMLFDRCDSPLGDLSLAEAKSRRRVLEINGEHSMTITTKRAVISEGTRALTCDKTGKWSEWVCDQPDELHQQGQRAEGTYHFVWSLQYDLQSVYGAELRPGIPNPVSAAVALAAALNGTSRWTVGTVDVAGTGGLSMYDNSAWERLSDVVGVFGGEVDAEIEVGATGVISRRVALRARLGSTDVTRRFDWSHDLTSIRRTVVPGPRYCRVIPRGKGLEVESSTGGTAWTRRINIKSVNGGVEYLRDTDMEAVYRVPDGSGGYEYPTTIVIYEDIEDPAELLAKSQADLHNHTRPLIIYEADGRQLESAGVNIRGLALGDDFHVVDRDFFAAAEGVGLRLRGRVLRLEIEDKTDDVDVTFGSLQPTLADSFSGLSSQIRQVESLVRDIQAGGTIVYLEHLIDQLNAEINATGGYSYIVDGEGLVTYDTAVANPLVGSEATKVVQVKGGAIRIADTKKPNFASINDWNWKSVFVSGHVAAELITAVNVVTGWLGSINGTYIDLDNNTVNFGPTSGYHFTVDTNGIKHWYGTTLLGQYLSTSMQVGKSDSSHVSVGTSGVELFDASGTSAFFAGLSGSSTIVRCGRASGSGNVVMSSDGYVRVRSGSEVIAHFGKATYELDGVSYDGSYYNLGTRSGDPGVNTIVGGVDNFAGVQCWYGSAFGRGLIAPDGGSGGMAIGKYNVSYGSNDSTRRAGPSLGLNLPVFVIGNGSSASNRSNALEVDSLGNLCIAGALKSSKVFVPITSSVSGETPATGSGTYSELTNIKLDALGTWLVFINLTFFGLTTSSASTEARGSVSTQPDNFGTTVCKMITSKGALSASGVYTTNAVGTRLYLNAGCLGGTNPTVSGSMTVVRIA